MRGFNEQLYGRVIDGDKGCSVMAQAVAAGRSCGCDHPVELMVLLKCEKVMGSSGGPVAQVVAYCPGCVRNGGTKDGGRTILYQEPIHLSWFRRLAWQGNPARITISDVGGRILAAFGPRNDRKVNPINSKGASHVQRKEGQ